MKTNILLSLILAGTFSVANAQTEAEQSSNTSTLKASEVQKAEEKVKDIDEEITNARMRATLGSKSKWSFKSAFGYNGGSVEKPFESVRPNYRAGANKESVAVLSGTVGINYRATAADNITLNTGVSIMDPLHGDITKPANDPRTGADGEVLPRYQVTTPTLGWSRGYKAAGMQMISDISYSHYTDSDSAESGDMGDISLGQTVLADFGTRLSGGVSLSGSYQLFNGNPKSNVAAAYAKGVYKRTDMMIALYPFAEYTLNDTFSLRTVFGYFEFLHYKNEYNNSQKFFQKEPYQSVGVGVSITRDIYIYPNIQFTPKDIRADRTNVALSANVNLF